MTKGMETYPRPPAAAESIKLSRVNKLLSRQNSLVRVYIVNEAAPIHAHVQESVKFLAVHEV